VHERTVHELLELSAPGTDYSGRDEDGRIAILLQELATARPLASPFLTYAAETTAERGQKILLRPQTRTSAGQ